MFSFQSFIFLAEDRIKFLKDLHKDKPISTDHDAFATHKDSNDIIDHFASHDPHPKKANTQWMVNQYKKGHIRQEDAPSVGNALSEFGKYKGKLEKKDINQYGHVADLRAAIAPHLGQVASNKEQKKIAKDEGAPLIHEEGGLTVHHVKTQDAASRLGAGTEWCTRAASAPYFKNYTSQGPLYVIHTPENEKFQFHFETRQFMDKDDKEIDTHEFVKKYPQLKNVQEFKTTNKKIVPDVEANDGSMKTIKMATMANVPFLHDHEKKEVFDNIMKYGEDHERTEVLSSSLDHAKDFVKNYGTMDRMLQNSKTGTLPPHHIEHYSDVISNSHHDKEIDDILKDAPFSHVRRNVSRRRPELGEHFMNDRDDITRSFVAKNRPDLAAKMINDKHPQVRRMAAYHDELTHHFVNDVEPEIRAIAAGKPHLAHHFAEDDSDMVRRTAAQHPKTAHLFLNDPNTKVKEILIRNHGLGEHFINDKSEITRSAVAERHPELAHHFVNDTSVLARGYASRHPETAHLFVNDPEPKVRKEVAHHQPHLAHHFVNDSDESVRAYAARHSPVLFANDSAKHIRLSVASHPEGSRAILDKKEDTPDVISKAQKTFIKHHGQEAYIDHQMNKLAKDPEMAHHITDPKSKEIVKDTLHKAAARIASGL